MAPKILGLKKNVKKNFRSEKYFVSENNFQKNLVLKNFGLKKVLFEKILVQNFFWNQYNFGLKILGPKNFGSGKKVGVQKKI